MHYRLDILLAGRSKAELAPLEPLLTCSGSVNLRVRHISNGHADPLHDVDPLPDAVVFHASGNWRAELESLAERPPSQRPPLLVIGPDGDLDLIRMSMRAGARDFFSAPVSEQDVEQFLEKILREKRAELAQRFARMTAVMNAKGGSGASVIAANVARIFAQEPQRRVVLLDMDLQFGALPLYFNVTPRNGLLRALEAAESLDAVAMEGYVQPHGSGLDLLAAAPDDSVGPAEIPEARVEMLLEILGRAYNDVVVDLPRRIDPATALVLEHSDRIVIPMQQSLAHLRDTKRLVHILQQELSVALHRMLVVVNRYDKRSPVQLRDVREAVAGVPVTTLTNDFARVSESINIGTPLLDGARSASLTRDLLRLAEQVAPHKQASSKPRSSWNVLGWMRS